MTPHLMSCALDPKTHHYVCALTGNGEVVILLFCFMIALTLILGIVILSQIVGD